MAMLDLDPLYRFAALAKGAMHPPLGRRRILLAYGYGALCHSLFAFAILVMGWAMFHGMSQSWGSIPMPWAVLVNALLILQFPLVHSLLLTRRGASHLARMAPSPHGPTLATTSYALIASVQLLLLFGFWTPSGVIWWRADGVAFVMLCCAYGASWMVLGKAIYDAGVELQSGALGWMSLAQDRPPVFPGMPTGGLFRLIRQPIYVAFALTTWTIPVWTPDQLAVALSLTVYCLAAPRLKERRFAARYGAEFAAYRATVPYAVPYAVPNLGKRIFGKPISRSHRRD